MIKTIDIQAGETTGLYQYLSGAITPRPIAFVSTVDQDGNKNLSPFSFFNVFSINPPVLVFSPVRRVRDNSLKHTLNNVTQTKECVIALVTEEITQQVSLSSCDFDKKTREHLKDINEVAYIRFASVYRQFDGINDFMKTLDSLKPIKKEQLASVL